MINIKGVGLDLSFKDNIQLINENGFKEIKIPELDMNTDKFRKFSKFFDQIQKFNDEDTNILIAGKNNSTVFTTHYISNMSEIAYFKWVKSLLGIYHSHDYSKLNINEKQFPEAFEVFAATDTFYNVHYMVSEKLENTFSILSMVISPKNIGLTTNSNGGYTQRHMIRKNEDFTVGEILGSLGTLVGIFGIM